MTIYKHYGVDVTRQITEKDFREFLKEEGVSYTDLPILSVDALKYEKHGQEKYAVTKYVFLPEQEPLQYIYIADRIPADLDFENLMRDVDAQANGADPEKMKSKLLLILEKAEDTVKAQQDQSQDIFNMLTGGQNPDYKEIAKTIMIEYGYSRQQIEQLDNSDVDTEYLTKVLEHMQ